jgi:hypothetical protein
MESAHAFDAKRENENQQHKNSFNGMPRHKKMKRC